MPRHYTTEHCPEEKEWRDLKGRKYKIIIMGCEIIVLGKRL